MRFPLILAAAIGLATPTPGQAPEGGAAKSHEARKGDFTALLLLTDDQEGFLQAWAGPTPPHLVTTDRVRRGQVITAMLLFSGCSADAKGKCELSADYLIHAPDGTVYGEHKGVKVWDEAPAPGHNIQLSATNMSIRIEPGEQLGRYRIRIALTDKVAGTTLEVSDAFTALEAETAIQGPNPITAASSAPSAGNRPGR